jgi:hypothetical protein
MATEIGNKLWRLEMRRVDWGYVEIVENSGDLSTEPIK